MISKAGVLFYCLAKFILLQVENKSINSRKYCEFNYTKKNKLTIGVG